MITFYQKYRKDGRFSQFGDQGIIDEIISRIKPTSLTSVEFGAPTRDYCSNTAHLQDLGWESRFIDINPNPDPRIECAEVTPENVTELTGSPTVWSCDCDGPDATIWAAYKGNAPVVIIEIDSSVLPPAVQEPSRHNAASYQVMVELGVSKGYKLICHTGGNLVWVLDEYKHLFPEITADPLKDWELYFDKRHI